MRAFPLVSDAEVRRENANLVRRLCDVALRKPKNTLPSSPAVFLHESFRRRQVNNINKENRELLRRLERARAHVPKVEETEKMYALHVQRQQYCGGKRGVMHAEKPEEVFVHRESKPKRKERSSRRRDDGSRSGEREHSKKQRDPRLPTEIGSRAMASTGPDGRSHPWDRERKRPKEALSAREVREHTKIPHCGSKLSKRRLGEPISARERDCEQEPDEADTSLLADRLWDCGRPVSPLRDRNAKSLQNIPGARCRGVEQQPKTLSPDEHFGPAKPMLYSDTSDISLESIAHPFAIPTTCSAPDAYCAFPPRSQSMKHTSPSHTQTHTHTQTQTHTRTPSGASNPVERDQTKATHHSRTAHADEPSDTAAAKPIRRLSWKDEKAQNLKIRSPSTDSLKATSTLTDGEYSDTFTTFSSES